MIGAAGTIEVYSYDTETWATVASGLGNGRISIAVGDVNGDQRNDIVALEPNSIWVVLAESAGHFEEPIAIGHKSEGTRRLPIAVADLNQDRLADIIIGDGHSIQVYISEGAFFEDSTMNPPPHPVTIPTLELPLDIAVADVSRDGLADIVAVQNSIGLQVYQSGQDERERSGFYAGPRYPLKGAINVGVLDIDNDQHPDMVATSETTIEIFSNTGAAPQQQLGAFYAITEEEQVEHEGLDQTNSIAAGKDHTCALDANGQISCWGEDSYRGRELLRPPTGQYASITSGNGFSCALDTDGQITCWGYDVGRLKALEPPAGQYTAISTGNYDSCALNTAGEITCWGGYASHGSIRIPPSPSQYVAVTIGPDHGCGIRNDQTLACWHRGGWATQSREPPDGQYIAVTAGEDHSCAIRTDQTITCWGDERFGDWAGQGTPPEGTFTAITTGHHHSCAIRTDQTIACWGANWAGDSTLPDWVGQASRPEGTFTAVSASQYHTCAIRTDQTIACWGSDWNGKSTPPGGNSANITGKPKLTSNPPPTEDLIDKLGYVAVPESPVDKTGYNTFIWALPGTENAVVGWAWQPWAWEEAYDGAIDVVFDGWTVEHFEANGHKTARVTMFLTLDGNYTITRDLSDPLTVGRRLQQS